MCCNSGVGELILLWTDWVALIAVCTSYGKTIEIILVVTMLEPGLKYRLDIAVAAIERVGAVFRRP